MVCMEYLHLNEREKARCFLLEDFTNMIQVLLVFKEIIMEDKKKLVLQKLPLQSYCWLDVGCVTGLSETEGSGAICSDLSHSVSWMLPGRRNRGERGAHCIDQALHRRQNQCSTVQYTCITNLYK